MSIIGKFSDEQYCNYKKNVRAKRKVRNKIAEHSRKINRSK